jgi:DNA transformation protein
MAVTNSYLEYILERLAAVGPVTARRMFGGVGLYSGSTFFALIDNDTLYFKVNDGTRSDFESAGMEPFRPFGEDSYAMKYYSVPEHVIESDPLLREWTSKALAAATKGKKRKN